MISLSPHGRSSQAEVAALAGNNVWDKVVNQIEANAAKAKENKPVVNNNPNAKDANATTAALPKKVTLPMIRVAHSLGYITHEGSLTLLHAT